jgi:prepilin-type N-terminal cleavage/methylation domain-containing protein
MIVKKLKANKGVTLIEVLVAAVIALIATGAALELYISQQQGWIAQENITDMQQNGRAAVDELVYHIRQAGYHIPPALEAIYAANTNPDTISLVYLKEPICDAELIDTMGSIHDDLVCYADSVDCFEPNTWAYVYNASADRLL